MQWTLSIALNMLQYRSWEFCIHSFGRDSGTSYTALPSVLVRNLGKGNYMVCRNAGKPIQPSKRVAVPKGTHPYKTLSTRRICIIYFRYVHYSCCGTFFFQFYLVNSFLYSETVILLGWGTMLQSGRSRGRFPRRSFHFFNWPKPSSRNMALGSNQPLT
jgi:hypothetical protein